MHVASIPSKPSAWRFALVVFDIDDTLFCEMDYVRSGYAAVAAHLAFESNGSSEDILQRMWRCFARDRRTVFDAILAEMGLSDRIAVASLVEVYRNHEPRITLPEQAADVLTCLRHWGMHLAAVTDGPLSMQQRKAGALGLDQYVDQIIFTDALPAGCAKPSPVAFQQLMDGFSVRPMQCVYVADNPRKDFLGPRQLGWFTVQFVSENSLYGSEQAPPGGIPHKKITCLADVLDLK